MADSILIDMDAITSDVQLECIRARPHLRISFERYRFRHSAWVCLDAEMQQDALDRFNAHFATDFVIADEEVCVYKLVGMWYGWVVMGCNQVPGIRIEEVQEPPGTPVYDAPPTPEYPGV